MTFEKWFDENYGNLEFSQVIKNALKEIALKAWQAAQPQWQPIETAPKDETLIDIYSTSHGRLCDYHLHFNKSGKPFYSGIKEIGFIVRDATHWMPKPQPPNV